MCHLYKTMLSGCNNKLWYIWYCLLHFSCVLLYFDKYASEEYESLFTVTSNHLSTRLFFSHTGPPLYQKHQSPSGVSSACWSIENQHIEVILEKEYLCWQFTYYKINIFKCRQLHIIECNHPLIIVTFYCDDANRTLHHLHLWLFTSVKICHP